MQARHNVLGTKIYETYILLAAAITVYLISAHTVFFEFYILSALAVFPLLFMIYYTNNAVYLLAMSFCLGHIHVPLFEKIYLIDPFIVSEALYLTIMVFVGLSYFAYVSENYNVFAMYGILYSMLSTLCWLIIINLFIIDNTFFEMLLTYFGTVLFAIYVVVDTQYLLMDNNHSALQHATTLFLDFVNLFINILDILRDDRNERKRR